MSSIPNTKTALVVGDSGAGKSFLINLLVGKNACYSANSRQSVTKDCQLASVLGDNGVEFRFIDTPGINDTEMENSKVQERLWEFGHFAPDGLNAIIVVIPRGRFNKAVHDDLVAMEEFFSDRIWKHSIVVYNQTEDRRETIWEDTQSKWQSPWILKWKSAKTVICTVDEVRKNADKQPIRDDRTEQAVRDLMQAIVTRPEPYQHATFEKARQDKVTQTRQAMSDLTTATWRREMKQVNDELMEGRMSRQEWLTRKEQIKASDTAERNMRERERQEREAKEKAQKEAQDEKEAKEQAERATAAAEAKAKEARQAEAQAEKDRKEKEAADDAARRSSWNVTLGTVAGAAGGALLGGPVGAVMGAAVGGASTAKFSK